MKVWKIAGVGVLFALVTIYICQEIQFRKPLTLAEIDGLAAITAGQMDCNWRYDSTRKGEWLRQRSVAERKADVTFQARFMTAMGKYEGLDPDEQCALLDKFHDLVRRWHD
ncbi:hypothetical protein [Rhizobium mayense]|uniref:Uncharacterized protein n=1 Tax=Rhizobium mayense TaxID=1312184 RepID=A0ABT7K5U5_9HYPH|nr:hypothetical protein [Rhizobium mayense]MDL2403994.1 hypothetical protein [Rhizobium mayense]